MNIQQLEYIVAVDTYRHFATAANHCFVTQPTLSMMIRKLEKELDVQLFDRSRQPVIPTEAGSILIQQARVVLQEVAQMRELVNEMKSSVHGELRLGIIPTLAPYLLPRFLSDFIQAYPDIQLHIVELTTNQIIERLRQQSLDLGILATPLQQPGILEEPLFYEQFVVYAPAMKASKNKKYIIRQEINAEQLWLLEEGHCLRTQVLDLCELRKEEQNGRLHYQTGSIETIRKMAEIQQGITILPELALNDLSTSQQQHLRFFKPPTPVREISLVTYRHFVKRRLVALFKERILANIPESMQRNEPRQVLGVQLD